MKARRFEHKDVVARDGPPTTRPPVLMMGLIGGLAVVGGLFFVAIVSGRRSSTSSDETASSCLARQDAEIEALRLRVATLSARLAGAGVCPAAPDSRGPSPAAPPLGHHDDGDDEGDDGRPASGAVALLPASDAAVAAVDDARSMEPDGPALATTWATETFLRELVRGAAPTLALNEVVCSDDLCRLNVRGRGTPEDDALALQTFVGRTAERLPRALIQPGADGAVVVLVARPGHELASLPARLASPPPQAE